MMIVSFIDINSTNRTFRFYCIQGCSRLYRWEELAEDRRVLDEIRAKIIIKGRIPRSVDFQVNYRQGWDQATLPVITHAQSRMLQMMPHLAPLLPIKASVSELAQHALIGICPIYLNTFLDGRTGMSYGFLAYQIPTGMSLNPSNESRGLSLLLLPCFPGLTSTAMALWMVFRYDRSRRGQQGGEGPVHAQWV